MHQRGYTSWHHWFFLKIFRAIFGPFFRVYYRFKGRQIAIKKTGPYLILANHTAEFDIILLDMMFDAPLYFVASEQLLNAGKGSWFLRTFFNPIPKSKSMADMAVVKRMKSVLAEGGNVAIFPEGNATMHGGPSSIPSGLGRLIKFLNVPVKIMNIHGLYLSAPRWAYFRKFGPTTIQEKLTLNLPDIQNMAAEEVEQTVLKALQVSAYHQHPRLYHGRRLAEGLHKLIFTCPACGDCLSTYSKNHTIACYHCAWRATYQKDGLLNDRGKTVTLIEADQHNKQRFHKWMKDHWQHANFVFPGELAPWRGGNTKRGPFRKVRVEFSQNGLKLTQGSRVTTYGFKDILGQAIQVRTKLIVYLQSGMTLLFRFPRQYSPYFMLMMMQWYAHAIKEGPRYEPDFADRDADTILGI